MISITIMTALALTLRADADCPPPDLTEIPPAAWDRAEQLAAAFRSLPQQTLTCPRAKEIGRQVALGWRTVYRYWARFRVDPRVTALIPKPRGNRRGRWRLSPAQETIIQDVLQPLERAPWPVCLCVLMVEIARRCHAAGIPMPSRSSVDRRVRAAYPTRIVRRPGGEQPRPRPATAPGEFQAEQPLDVVQIDHTPMDLIIVDDLYRRPIGRPWLTVAMDVATRAVVGLSVSLETPSAGSVALCIAHIVQPNSPWIAALGVEANWPMSGIPRCLHLDNAREFHSDALRRGCAQYGIQLYYRPRHQPHYGGHVERFVGTLMRRVHTLPGTTGANTRGRKIRASETKATLTLSELERWLVLEICERYHRIPHRGLHTTPFSAWQSAYDSRFSPLPLWLATDSRRVALDFLPAQRQLIRRDGVHLNHIRYWHPRFAQWIDQQFSTLVRYDPRDLSTVYVITPNGDYVDVAYANAARPAISLWEQRAALAQLKQNAKQSINEVALFDAIEAQRRIIAASARLSKTARRHQQRLSGQALRTLPGGSNSHRQAQPEPVDYEQPALIFPVEEWD